MSNQINLTADEIIELKLSGRVVAIFLQLLAELPYHTAKPIIEDIENQVKDFKESCSSNPL
jgi:hypothetical protein